MDDSLVVRGCERIGNLTGNRHGFLQGNRPLPEPLRQSSPLHQLHY